MLLAFIVIVAIIFIDEYLDSRGRYQYSVTVGEEDKCAVKEYKIYDNNRFQAISRAIDLYHNKNGTLKSKINVHSIELL